MKIAMLIYPGFTALDIVGPFDVLSRLPGAKAVFVAKSLEPVPNDNHQLSLLPAAVLSDLPDPDVLVVPGGVEGTRQAAQDQEIVEWVAKAHAGSRYTTSVCTGSLILGAAGVLKGLEATTHWAAKDDLEAFGASYKPERWVQQGKIVTAAGVSAGIDMALFLAAEIAGEVRAQAIQLGIEYDPAPPFDSGSLSKASPETLAVVQEVFG